jgi:replicative DNA helicase
MVESCAEIIEIDESKLKSFGPGINQIAEARCPHVVDAMRNTMAEADFLYCLSDGDLMARMNPEQFAMYQPSILLAGLPPDALTFHGEPLMSHPDFQEIFLAMVMLIRFPQPLRWPFVLEMLERNGATKRRPKADWMRLFGYIENELGVCAYVPELIRILLERRQARALDRAYRSAQTALLAGNEGAANKAAGVAQEILRIAAESRERGPVGSQEAFEESLAQIEVRCEAARTGQWVGLPLGIRPLDDALRGMRPGQLIILAARPGMGKSTLAIQIILNNARSVGVLFVSLEMNRQEVLEKMIAIKASIPFDAIHNGVLSDSQRERVRDSNHFFDRAGFVIDDLGGRTIGSIAATAIAQKTKDHRLGLIVVDYLQLAKANHRSDNRQVEVAEISKGLKALAKTLAVPVIALAQLNRKCEDRSGVKKSHERKPKLSDLRESGQIEQDADVVVFLNRELGGNTQACIAKGRTTRTVDWFDLRFDTNTVSFHDATHDEGEGI